MPEDEHNSFPLTRRQALRAGSLAIASGLAGCNTTDNIPYGRGSKTPLPDWEPSETSNEPSSYQPVPGGDVMKIEGETGQFSFTALPTFVSIEHITGRMTGHPDSRVSVVTVEDDSVTVSINSAAVYRDVEAKLHIQDQTGDWNTRETTLDADHEQGEDPHFTTKTFRFDISDITLQTHIGQRAVITLKDSAARDDYSATNWRILKTHTFIGFPYHHPSNGRTTRWLNDDSWNYTAKGGRSQSPTFPQGYFDAIDHSNGDRTVFYALYTQNHFWGAAVTIDRNRYLSRYREAKAPARVMFEPYNAHKYACFQLFAREIKTALQKADVWNNLQDRHYHLSFLIKRMKYYRWNGDGLDRNPTTILWEGHGDCSGKTMLHLALIRTDAFENLTGAYFATQLNGLGHVTSAINIEDLGFTEETVPTGWYTLSFSQSQQQEGAPDATYAFCEVTGGRARIGEYNPSLYSNTVLFDNVDLPLHPRYRNR